MQRESFANSPSTHQMQDNFIRTNTLTSAEPAVQQPGGGVHGYDVEFGTQDGGASAQREHRDAERPNNWHGQGSGITVERLGGE